MHDPLNDESDCTMMYSISIHVKAGSYPKNPISPGEQGTSEWIRTLAQMSLVDPQAE
jgi:hypothetical protein